MEQIYIFILTVVLIAIIVEVFPIVRDWEELSDESFNFPKKVIVGLALVAFVVYVMIVKAILYGGN